jgi:hypothetical protein
MSTVGDSRGRRYSGLEAIASSAARLYVWRRADRAGKALDEGHEEARVVEQPVDGPKLRRRGLISSGSSCSHKVARPSRNLSIQSLQNPDGYWG